MVAPTDEVQQLREENAVLRAQIEWLKKQLFGPGKSEALDRAQLLLKLGELEKLAATTRPTATITYERPAGPAPKRTLPAESFAHLPVKETIEIVPELVRADPSVYERIGEERTFEVDIVPPQLFKREIVRPKFRHCLDRNRAPLLAPAPARIALGGFASAGLIAWALTAKYADHLPLYRQERMLARWGAPISRQNLSDWTGLATALLEPLVKRMKQALLAGGYVVVDETPIRCNDPDLRDGKTTQGWLWALSHPGGDVIFEWRLSRRHEEAEKLLGKYQGLLPSDAYEAYPAYAKTHPGVVWLGCWAHARRKFHEALAEAPVRAGFVLRLIGHLYHYESQWRRAGPALRAARRQGHFGLTLALLKKTAQRLQQLALPRSQLGQACAYLLGHWAPLTAHLAHGRTQLDTNAVENAIRPSKLGAKNWLFVGHPDAGDRAAVLYSLIISAQRHGHDPHAYLKDVLTQLPTITTNDDLGPLLPSQWKPAATTAS
ncbi:IS66 family transposase [Horticoccus luteus]|uniref:IS66 family transposase n=1 Tax=Horticoccus luteus TaxID=2862869 RepID=A0A8F9TVG8_9BACT|nr:IS66 family transposase [Horticoccus luteus]QYM78332.1 IS66 family transposase [Horticoccus luteus]